MDPGEYWALQNHAWEEAEPGRRFVDAQRYDDDLPFESTVTSPPPNSSSRRANSITRPDPPPSDLYLRLTGQAPHPPPEEPAPRPKPRVERERSLSSEAGPLQVFRWVRTRSVHHKLTAQESRDDKELFTSTKRTLVLIAGGLLVLWVAGVLLIEYSVLHTPGASAHHTREVVGVVGLLGGLGLLLFFFNACGVKYESPDRYVGAAPDNRTRWD